MQTQAFVEEVLGYRWITNYASRTAKVWPVLEVDGNGFHGETGRFGFAHEKNPYIYNVETPDGLVPAGERGRTVFRYADSNVSAAVCATMELDAVYFLHGDADANPVGRDAHIAPPDANPVGRDAHIAPPDANEEEGCDDAAD